MGNAFGNGVSRAADATKAMARTADVLAEGTLANQRVLIRGFEATSNGLLAEAGNLVRTLDYGIDSAVETVDRNAREFNRVVDYRGGQVVGELATANATFRTEASRFNNVVDYHAGMFNNQLAATNQILDHRFRDVIRGFEATSNGLLFEAGNLVRTLDYGIDSAVETVDRNAREFNRVVDYRGGQVVGELATANATFRTEASRFNNVVDYHAGTFTYQLAVTNEILDQRLLGAIRAFEQRTGDAIEVIRDEAGEFNRLVSARSGQMIGLVDARSGELLRIAAGMRTSADELVAVFRDGTTVFSEHTKPFSGLCETANEMLMSFRMKYGPRMFYFLTFLAVIGLGLLLHFIANQLKPNLSLTIWQQNHLRNFDEKLKMARSDATSYLRQSAATTEESLRQRNIHFAWQNIEVGYDVARERMVYVDGWYSANKERAAALQSATANVHATVFIMLAMLCAYDFIQLETLAFVFLTQVVVLLLDAWHVNGVIQANSDAYEYSLAQLDTAQASLASVAEQIRVGHGNL